MTVDGVMSVPRQGDVAMGNYTNGASGDGMTASSDWYKPPIGSVIAWLKSYTNTPSLPAGWVECDGTVLSDTNSPYHGQTLPNLNGNNRFLRGNNSSGSTGGVSTVALSTAELPSHTHDAGTLGGTTSTNTHNHAMNSYYPSAAGMAIGVGASRMNRGIVWGTQDSHSHTLDITGATASTGSGAAHENKPPYYEVVWIMRVK